MEGEKIILDYAKVPPRWRKWVARGLLATLAFVVIGAVWHWWDDISRPLLMWYWQRQCRSYALPPAEIVLETDPKSIADILARRHANYAQIPAPFGGVTLNRVPPSAWAHLSAKLSGKMGGDSVIFLHERTSRGTAGGNARLVAVRPLRVVTPITPPSPAGEQSQLYLQVIKEGTPRRLPKLLSIGFMPFGPLVNGAPDPLMRIYAGQPDPADPSHFTFDYEMWGQRDTIDGHLEANDSITITSRHPPTPPTTTTAP